MAFEQEQIGNCTLYRGDALEVVPTLSGIEAVVTDPPYGIGFGFARVWGPSQTRMPYAGPATRCSVRTPWQHNVYGDDLPFDPTVWLQFSQVILWGGNHFANALPNQGGWLVWDKRAGGTSDNWSDAELAWTNLPGPLRLYTHLWRGALRAGHENPVHGPKLHPCQKPLALMRWCVEKTTGTVLDPYMGSGTTGLACVELGRPFIGIEIERQYFDVACQRLTEAQRQLSLLVEA